jgi:hypothetical protein
MHGQVVYADVVRISCLGFKSLFGVYRDVKEIRYKRIAVCSTKLAIISSDRNRIRYCEVRSQRFGPNRHRRIENFCRNLCERADIAVYKRANTGSLNIHVPSRKTITQNEAESKEPARQLDVEGRRAVACAACRRRSGSCSV